MSAQEAGSRCGEQEACHDGTAQTPAPQAWIKVNQRSLGDVFICFHMFSYVFWFSGMKHDDVDSEFAVNLSIDECNELSCAASSMYVNTLEDVLSH